MRLAVAAAHFDKVLCVDAFNPTVTLVGQLDLFDDSRRDGTTVLRRILSVAGGTTMPARRVLTIHNEQWLVGQHENDSFSGQVVRDKFVIQRASGPCTIRTAAQALSSGGVSSYGSALWVKDGKEIEISAKLSGFFNIYLPSTETVRAADVLTLAGYDYIVRNTLLSAAGFLVAEAEQLPAASIQSATFTPYTYTPATDAIVAGTPVTLQLLRLRFQVEYEFPTASAPKLEPGDIRALILKGVTVATPKPNDRVTLADGQWLIHTVSDEGGCWGFHLRRAPA